MQLLVVRFSLARAELLPVYLQAPLDVRRARMRHRAVNSGEDLRTLVPDVDARADAAFRGHRARRAAGRFIIVDAAQQSPSAIVAIVCASLAQASRRQRRVAGVADMVSNDIPAAARAKQRAT